MACAGRADAGRAATGVALGQGGQAPDAEDQAFCGLVAGDGGAHPALQPAMPHESLPINCSQSLMVELEEATVVVAGKSSVGRATHGTIRHHLVLVLLIVLWYVSFSFANVLLHRGLVAVNGLLHVAQGDHTLHQDPLLLAHLVAFVTLLQLAGGLLAIGTGSVLTRHKEDVIVELTVEGRTRSVTGRTKEWAQASNASLGLAYCMATASTNYALVFGSAVHVQSLKALEPVITVVLNACAVDSLPTNWLQLPWVLLISVGAVLISTGEGALETSASTSSLKCVLAAMVSSILLPMRNILVKKEERKGPVLTILKTYLYSTIWGLVFFAVITLASWTRHRVVAQSTSSTVDAVYDVLGGVLCHIGYNLASILILLRLSLTTHSILNTGKRLVGMVAGLWLSAGTHTHSLSLTLTHTHTCR